MATSSSGGGDGCFGQVVGAAVSVDLPHSVANGCLALGEVGGVTEGVNEAFRAFNSSILPKIRNEAILLNIMLP